MDVLRGFPSRLVNALHHGFQLLHRAALIEVCNASAWKEKSETRIYCRATRQKRAKQHALRAFPISVSTIWMPHSHTRTAQNMNSGPPRFSHSLKGFQALSNCHRLRFCSLGQSARQHAERRGCTFTISTSGLWLQLLPLLLNPRGDV